MLSTTECTYTCIYVLYNLIFYSLKSNTSFYLKSNRITVCNNKNVSLAKTFKSNNYNPVGSRRTRGVQSLLCTPNYGLSILSNLSLLDQLKNTPLTGSFYCKQHVTIMFQPWLTQGCGKLISCNGVL